MELNRLEELLKKKGVGPQGSKSLSDSELEELADLFMNEDYSVVTKATMLVALLILDPNPHEQVFLERIKSHPDVYLPQPLMSFLSSTYDYEGFHGALLKVIHKIDLTYQEAFDAFSKVLNNEVEDYLKAAFLEGQRLKRESFEENKAFFDVLTKAVDQKLIDIPVLIDICDAYDGSNRTMSFSPFIAATLGAMGFPCVIHGIERVAPKQGYTSNLILQTAGKDVRKSLRDVEQILMDANVAWGYIDQEVFFPKLAGLKAMRKEMVKRPFLATFEKLLQPIMSQKGNYVFTGYTHKHYRAEVPNQLKEQGKAKKALVMRGVEGSTALNMSRSIEGILYDGKEVLEIEGDPQVYDVPYLETQRDYAIDEKQVVALGVKALEGEENYAFHNIVYTICLILDQFQLMPKETSKDKVLEVLKNGAALTHWNNFS